MKFEQMEVYLKQWLRSGTYIHSVNTMKTAVSLAEHYGENTEQAAVAGLLHDCAKDLQDNETLNYCRKYEISPDEVEERQVFLLHGKVGAIIAREIYQVEDMAVLKAIQNHTTGHTDMSMLDKIVFLADYIEPGRNHSMVAKVRKLAYDDIDKALVSSFDNTIEYVISQKGLLHPNTIIARNRILMNISGYNESKGLE